MCAEISSACRIAIGGASTLLGKEIKTLLEERGFPFADLQLYDDLAPVEDLAGSWRAGTLTAAAGEPAVIQAIEEDSFARADLVFFAASPEFTQRHWPSVRRAGSGVVDLSGGLLSAPEALPWIPALDAVLAPPRGPSTQRVFVSPPAAAIVACSITAALAPFHPARVIFLFLQPVSERGQDGIEELENQTVNLLSFQPIAQNVFDSQVAFNLLSRFGDASTVQLRSVREAILRSVQRYLDGRVPVPALQLIQAPVFYSYAFSAFVDFGAAVELREVERALAAAGLQWQGAEGPAPSNVSVAGQHLITLARPEPDSSVPHAFWLWGAADNICLAAYNGVSIAERLFAS
jgi:aspartate-semialdehyde dehydrogenase